MTAPLSASLALQSAILTALAANPDLTALTGGHARIYDFVPPGASYPYVTFGQSVERDWSTASEDGREHTLTLQIWSRAAGRAEVYRAAAVIRAALHLAKLPLTGFNLVSLRYQFQEARRELDGETFRAIVRFRAVTEPV